VHYVLTATLAVLSNPKLESNPKVDSLRPEAICPQQTYQGVCCPSPPVQRGDGGPAVIVPARMRWRISCFFADHQPSREEQVLRWSAAAPPRWCLHSTTGRPELSVAAGGTGGGRNPPLGTGVSLLGAVGPCLSSVPERTSGHHVATAPPPAQVGCVFVITGAAVAAGLPAAAQMGQELIGGDSTVGYRR
jgi:hypothetical protein